jgi:hypothetical protein
MKRPVKVAPQKTRNTCWNLLKARYRRRFSKRTPSGPLKSHHYEDFFCIRNGIWSYDSASAAAKARHCEEVLDLSKIAFSIVDCSSGSVVSPGPPTLQVSIQ